MAWVGRFLGVRCGFGSFQLNRLCFSNRLRRIEAAFFFGDPESERGIGGAQFHDAVAMCQRAQSMLVVPGATKLETEVSRPVFLFFDGVVSGVKGKDGKVVGEEKVLEFGQDKLPGRELVVDKGKQRIRFRAVLRDTRLYQVAVIGTAAFVAGRDASGFIESLALTK